jgi:hypothetical protein
MYFPLFSLFAPVYNYSNKNHQIINDEFFRKINLAKKEYKKNFNDDYNLMSYDEKYKNEILKKYNLSAAKAFFYCTDSQLDYFKHIYNIYKNILKQYNLDPNKIHFMIGNEPAMIAEARSGISNLSNSTIVLDKKFLFWGSYCSTLAARSGISNLSNSTIVLDENLLFWRSYCSTLTVFDKNHEDTIKFLLAHEISHIKHKHTLKNTAFAIYLWAINYLINPYFFTISLYLLIIPLIYDYMKKNEKEADFDAMKKVGTKGAISFFEDLKNRQLEIRNSVLQYNTWFQKLLIKLQISPCGNSNLDFYHPKLTDRIEYFKDFKKKYNK